MKKLNWQKLPSRLTARPSMWTTASSDLVEPDYSSIQELFSLPPSETRTRPQTRIRTEPKEMSFIDAKKNLNLNVFLKHFKCSHEDFVSLIQRGDRSKFDVDVLKQLIKLLPEKHEVENLKSHRGDRDKLASVDQFYLLLLDVPSYSLRIQCMLLCEESSSLLETLRPKAELLDRACDSVRGSSRLSSFCKLILSVGNFLNYGSPGGNAGGFKISTLLKLTETKSNRSRITLLHHILEEAEKNHPDLLKLPDDLEVCEKAAGLSLESIQAETSSLIRQLKTCEGTVSSSSEDMKQQYQSVLQDNLQVCEQLQQQLSLLEDKRTDLSVYLCEDISTFSLDELLETIRTFRGLFLRVVKENESRRQQEKRKKLSEDSAHKISRTDGSLQDDGCIIDVLLAEIRRGYNLKRTQPGGSGVRRSPAVDQPHLQISSRSRPGPGLETQPSTATSSQGDQSQTKDQDPEGAQTKDQDPEGAQTKDQDPEGASETAKVSPGPAGSRDLTEEEFEESGTRGLQQDQDGPGPGPDQPSKTSSTGGGDSAGVVRPAKTRKGCVSL